MITDEYVTVINFKSGLSLKRNFIAYEPMKLDEFRCRTIKMECSQIIYDCFVPYTFLVHLNT
jgi:hypothetical protein